jgi:hypothetical protein
LDQDTIQRIATEVARHLPTYPWTLLAVQTVLWLLAAGAGAFFGEYFKKRGENLATKADFEDIKARLRTTTEMVGTIKSELAQKDWARREWTNLRRIKLEELLSQTDECGPYFQRQRASAFIGDLSNEQDPVSKS